MMQIMVYVETKCYYWASLSVRPVFTCPETITVHHHLALHYAYDFEGPKDRLRIITKAYFARLGMLSGKSKT